MIGLGADLSGIGNYIGAVDGFVNAVQDPRIQGNFMGHIMDKTRKAFYVETLSARETGKAHVSHVYEWGSEQGEVSNIRLFNLTKHGRGENRYMSYHFLPSTAPVPLPNPSTYGFPATSKKGNSLRRHVFTMKALVMETKSSVLIKPVKAKALFIPDATNKRGFFMSTHARINPGGPGATGGFATWWTLWFETRAEEIAKLESEKAEEVVAATGQKVIRHVAGTRINGMAVGGRFASGKGVSYGVINAAKQNAEMEAKNTFQRVWDEDEEMDDEF